MKLWIPIVLVIGGGVILVWRRHRKRIRPSGTKPLTPDEIKRRARQKIRETAAKRRAMVMPRTSLEVEEGRLEPSTTRLSSGATKAPNFHGRLIPIE